MRIALISLEPWDDVWRRNQHLAAQLVGQGLAEWVTFVEPPLLGTRATVSRTPLPGVDVVAPPLVLPKRLGGLQLTAWHLRRTVLRNIDVLWVNDPTLGVRCLSPGQPAVYDVTDDWRSFGFPARIRRRIVRAEARLAREAGTVVCSEVLRDRWQQRYGVAATLVHNGIDADAWAVAEPFALPGTAPHVGYIGTLHDERLDINLVLRLAGDERIGALHLVGPDALSEKSRAALRNQPRIRLHGPVAAADVPSWTKSMDVLISPHLVSDFTLSLDAIKSYEYLASGRPVVATPTSGFQLVDRSRVTIARAPEFLDGIAKATQEAHPPLREATDISWGSRAQHFSLALHRSAILDGPKGVLTS